MPKYYISSGDFQQVIDRESAKQAVIDAFKLLEDNPVALSSITVVSEKGFKSVISKNIFFPTLDILNQSEKL